VRQTLFVLLATIALALPLHAQPTRPLIRDFQPVEVWQPRGAGIQVWTLTLGGKRHDLRLEDNRSLLGRVAPATRATFARRGDRFLRGRIDGVEGSWVRLNRIDGSLSGAVYDGNELWLIDRAGAMGVTGMRGTRADRTIAYRFSDLDTELLFDHGGLEAPGTRAGKTPAPLAYDEFAALLTEFVALQGSSMEAVPITIVSDVEFSARHGSNAQAVVIARINFLDGIYSAQVGVGITLLHHEVLTDNGPLTSTDPGTLLSDQFGPFMRTGAGSNLPFGGLGHLFTDRNLNGSTVGIAYLGVLCNSGFGYGLTEDLSTETGSSLVFAHEVGHNLGAGHDNDLDSCPEGTFRGIMNSLINGEDQFSQCSVDAMAPLVASASCLVMVSDDLFADDFEAAP